MLDPACFCIIHELARVYSNGRKRSMGRPAVVGAEYCRPGQELNLLYTESSLSGDEVTDLDGKQLFKVRHQRFSITKILITDPTDRPILRLRQQGVFSTTWNAFKYGMNPVLFTVKKSSTFQWDLSMHVFLGSKPKPDKDQPDYKVKRAFGHRTIQILRGEEVVAKMKHNVSFCCCSSGDDITVAPGIDFAFVLSLFMIVRYLDRRRAPVVSGASSAAAGGGGECS